MHTRTHTGLRSPYITPVHLPHTLTYTVDVSCYLNACTESAGVVINKTVLPSLLIRASVTLKAFLASGVLAAWGHHGL